MFSSKEKLLEELLTDSLSQLWATGEEVVKAKKDLKSKLGNYFDNALDYIIREIEDVQDRIDFNLSKNKKRRDKLEIAMYLIAILLPVYLLISIMFFN